MDDAFLPRQSRQDKPAARAESTFVLVTRRDTHHRRFLGQYGKTGDGRHTIVATPSSSHHRRHTIVVWHVRHVVLHDGHGVRRRNALHQKFYQACGKVGVGVCLIQNCRQLGKQFHLLTGVAEFEILQVVPVESVLVDLTGSLRRVWFRRLFNRIADEGEFGLADDKLCAGSDYCRANRNICFRVIAIYETNFCSRAN